MKYLIFLLATVLISCNSSNDAEHTHDGEAGHAHDHGEGATADTTIWTGITELFVEYPALVVGRTSTFAAHFTILNGHKPVKDGSLTVSLIKGNRGIRNKVDYPSSPGIFRPALKPKEPGVYQLVFELKTPDFSDTIKINNVKVYESEEQAEKAIPDEHDDTGTISFLKEQAWKMQFQTVPAIRKEIYEVINTSGVWKVAPTDSRTLVANTSGTVSFRSGNLNVGGRVDRGQVIMTISSSGLTTNNLRAEIQKAKADLNQAEAEYNRKKELYDSRIISKAEFERAEQKYQVAKSEYEALSSGYTSGGKNVVVPMNGFIKSLLVNDGAFVEQGTALAVITSSNTNQLESYVSPEYSSQINRINNLWYKPAEGRWASMNETGGSIISVGKEVNRDNPMISVFARINDVVNMPEGSFTEVQIGIGNPVMTTVIPESALLEQYGSYSVIVQLSGETFELRPVVVGGQNGGEVAILQGLKPGEIVVTDGAYQVKMASMSGQLPAHGHVH